MQREGVKPLARPRFSLSAETMDGTTLFATRDHEVIRRWAERRQAEPATGEATASGPATVHVFDGGAGIRFNFPGAAPFRPIGWEEWFQNFDRYRLIFIYSEPPTEDVASRAFELWQRRGGGDGHALDDWLRAEAQVRASRGGSTQAYRLMADDDDRDV